MRLHVGVTWVNLIWTKVPNFVFDFYLNVEECYDIIEAKLRGIVPSALQDPSDVSPAAWYQILLLHATPRFQRQSVAPRIRLAVQKKSPAFRGS